MAKTSAVTLDDVADLDNLARAFWSAARGKREKVEVKRFAARLPEELSRLGEEIRELRVTCGDFHQFQIFDPKPRVIHVPRFRERVLHHALMAKLGPVLERGLVSDTYACRPGKGSLAAAVRAQQHARRFPWYANVDVRGYFASIDHGILLGMLERRFRDRGLLALCRRILAAHETAPGKGLPIGALTSQHFANLYLGPLDRFLLEDLRVSGMVRYMDDIVWWCGTRAQVRAALAAVTDFVGERLALVLRGPGIVQRSERGLSFLGYRVFPGTLRLSRRRRQRYRLARQRWEAAYRDGVVDARGLQAGYAAALAITAHADAASFRREDLRRRPPLCV